MHVALSEEQQAHLYSCLLVGNNEFQKIKKSLAKLNREDQKVDDEITINAQLRKLMNPRAEEEAREAERKRSDPAQLSIHDQPASSGETGGGIPAGQTVKLRIFGKEEHVPTDPELRDALMEQDFLVLLSDIRGWTSSDRDRVVGFLNEYIAWQGAEEEYAQPELPEILAFVSLTQERVDALTRLGPYKTVENFAKEEDAEPSSVSIFIPGVDEDAEDEEEGEYVDPVEAEIRCARLNRDAIKNADFPRELATRWFAAGPWSIMADSSVPVTEDTELHDVITPNRWYVVLERDGVQELAASEDDALLTAARYNRSVAGRDADGEWREPPVHVDADAVEEIRAAAEGGE